MMRPTIAVLGATGLQGGAVVTALLKHDRFLVRAVTRNAARAGDLAKKQDVQVVEADMGDKASLVQAFSGAAGVFIVTDYFAAGLDAEAEAQWGIYAVDAAKEAGVRHIMFSTLEDVRKQIPRGALPELPNKNGHVVPHSESKDAILEHLKASKVPWTALLTSCFMENFVTRRMYQRRADGARTWSDNLGSKPILAHAVADIGGSAAVVFADPAKYAGRVVPVVRERISWPQAAQILSEVTGIPVRYAPISDQEYAKLPYPGAGDIGVMWQYCRDFTAHEDQRPLSETVYQGPTFREWAIENKDALIAALNK